MTDSQIAFESFRDWLHTTIIAISEMETEEEDPMKVTITPTGEVAFDVDDIKEALALAAGLRDGAVTELPEEFQARKTAWEAEQESFRWEVEQSKPKKKAPKNRGGRPVSTAPALLQHLVDHDRPEGFKAKDLADVLGSATSTVNQRLRALEKKGLAERVSRGVWRAV